MGGFGESVARFVAENYHVPVKVLGVNDVFTQSGKGDLRKHYGLDGEGIARQTKEFIEKC